MKKSERLYRAEEVALIIGISLKTLNIWYQFKRENPDNEYAQMLPEPIKDGTKSTRYWTQENIRQIVEFQEQRPYGRNGIMGQVTHPYWANSNQTRKKKKKGAQNEKSSAGQT